MPHAERRFWQEQGQADQVEGQAERRALLLSRQTWDFESVEQYAKFAPEHRQPGQGELVRASIRTCWSGLCRTVQEYASYAIVASGAPSWQQDATRVPSRLIGVMDMTCGRTPTTWRCTTRDLLVESMELRGKGKARIVLFTS